MRSEKAPKVDLHAVRAKYRSERDKRLRDDGNEQYKEVTGDFAYFVDDPYIDEVVQRGPEKRDVDVVIIGGGFGGMLAAVRLKQQGIDDVVIIEKGGDFGGTWYWNRYPGASCDIESYIYFPLLEETGFVPQQKYTNAGETLAYCAAIAEKYELADKALFQTEVTATEWQENTCRWRVTTSLGDELAARFVVHANGPLNRPKLPAIEGIGNFKGHTFHTSRWDYAYTGGSSSGDLRGLADKKIAIIGTGATAIQCVPHVGASAAQLYVFQRTPSSVEVRNNGDTDAAWLKGQDEGWHDERRRNFETLLAGKPVKRDLVSDGWTDAFKLLVGGLRDKAPSRARLALWALCGLASPKLYKNGLKKYLTDKAMQFMNLAEEMEIADFHKMQGIRDRVDNVVDDAATAEALKPYYRLFCKRPCFHDDYLGTFNRPNVHLVDTQGRGVARITENAVMFDDVAYEVDCIIFATGFEVGTDYARRAGYQINGVDGLTISDKWADGMASFHGLHVRGFPNAFFFGPSQAGFSANFTYALDEQSRHVAYIVSRLKQSGKKRSEASAKAETAWVAEIVDKARDAEAFQEACTPGYYNNEGQLTRRRQDQPYGEGPVAFFDMLANWRARNRLDGLDIA
ncbi:MAG: Neopentalenolactone D synthase [Alphaproteobacteria bacterium]|nr:MAG: Neopentalenolactone D synthase [Alphaproteobacteria bacterium]